MFVYMTWQHSMRDTMTSMRSCRMNCHAKTNHPSIPNIMEQTLSKDVQEKLDMINWESLKDKYGISRDSFYNNPHLASQLVYGQMTDLVFAGKEDFSGMLSLRANMDTSGEKPEMKVKVFTMEKEKTEKDALYLYRQPITSEACKPGWAGRREPVRGYQPCTVDCLRLSCSPGRSKSIYCRTGKPLV